MNFKLARNLYNIWRRETDFGNLSLQRGECKSSTVLEGLRVELLNLKLIFMQIPDFVGVLEFGQELASEIFSFKGFLQ